MSDAQAPSQPRPDAAENQPIERLRRDGVEYLILGTAHVSRASMDAVQALLEHESFDAVAVELCASRAHHMRDPQAFKHMDLFQVIRQGKTGMVIASLALGAFQQRLAEQYGIEPGADMRAAVHGAEQRKLPLWLIDRDLGTTLKRTWRALSLGERLRILGGLAGSVFEREAIAEQEMEQLKQGDMLEGAFKAFARFSTPLYRSLIGERDAFMAARLRDHAARNPQARRVLVVIGAGHRRGLREQMQTQCEDAHKCIDALSSVPPAARWPKWLAIGVMLALLGLIGWAFQQNVRLGAMALRDWVLFTGGLAALGALAAGAHPLSILAAFIAAPLKPFRPGLPAGAFGALTEAWLRRPKVADFETLRSDVARWGGWWRNHVARAFLVFMLVNIGAIVGEYAAGIHIVSRLL